MISISLLGPLRIQADGRDPPPLPLKAQAMLAYLASHAGKRVSRKSRASYGRTAPSTRRNAACGRRLSPSARPWGRKLGAPCAREMAACCSRPNASR